MRRLASVLLLSLTGSCASAPPPPGPALPSSASVPRAAELDPSTPEAQGMGREPLVKLTRWIRDTPALPVFSLLVSRHGKLVYELYTSSFTPDDAHYLMSVTKSVVSALVGIAIDRHLVPGPDATVGDLLPRALFPSDADQARFRGLTMRQVMGMQGIDAPDPPRDRSPEALARYHRFWTAPSRLRFVLGEPLLGQGFQYNDATPTLATGVLRQVTGESVFRFEGGTATPPKDPGELAALLDEVHHGPPRLGDWIEYRMVPSAAPKGWRRDRR